MQSFADQCFRREPTPIAFNHTLKNHPKTSMLSQTEKARFRKKPQSLISRMVLASKTRPHHLTQAMCSLIHHAFARETWSHDSAAMKPHLQWLSGDASFALQRPCVLPQP